MPRPSFILFLIIILYLAFLIREGAVRHIQLRDEHRIMSQKAADEDRLNADLKKEIKLLDDPDHIEGIARQKLGLIKAGEEPYKVVDKQ